MKPLNVFPYDSKINFMRLRWISTILALGLMFAALGSMVFNSFPNGRFDGSRTFNYALDFFGGALVELRFEKPVDTELVRRRLADAGFPNAQVQSLGSETELLVREKAETEGSGEAVGRIADRIVQAVQMPGNAARVVRSDAMGKQVGNELASNAALALTFVIIGFLIYIAMRFEWKFAVAAILSTLHDVIVVLGWFAISGHEFDLTVLAGVLSVMGFSINDTIVVFDRVRENFRSMRADSVTILNASVNQTLSRTVITSFVAFLTVFALYVYGGGSLRGMAESQMIGIVVGTLSSIFVACPLLMWLGVSKQDLMPKARDEAALARRP
ncbi:MAG TPA: protein translocase subunit SecF [Lysobacter sp.]